MRTLYNQRRVIAKIVYYGPGLSGKTTNLEEIFQLLQPTQKISNVIKHTETEGDRTLYFDFLPVNAGKVGNFTVQLSLYTVPGQAHYQQTRKKVLEGTDGIVFVADSQPEMRNSNIQAIEEMREYLTENNLDPDTIPTVLQFNKRDLPEVMMPESMHAELKFNNEPYIEAVAVNAIGIIETLTCITKLTVDANRK